MKIFCLIEVALVAFVISYGSSAFASGSAWLPAPGGGALTLAYVWQSADEFYRGSKKVPTPANGEDLTQQTVWVDGGYGISDSVALDLRVGLAQGSFDADVAPRDQKNETGLTDFNLGITWRVVDEAVSSAPSIAVRLGGIVAGSYDTGHINSIGDGKEGLEFSGIIGKFINDNIALSGEVGYRLRQDIPDNIFVNVSGGVLLMNSIGISVNYEFENSTSGIDIGTPAFSPPRFPETEEDIHTISSALSFALSEQISLGTSYGRVIEGRNTGASDIFSVSLGYSF